MGRTTNTTEAIKAGVVKGSSATGGKKTAKPTANKLSAKQLDILKAIGKLRAAQLTPAPRGMVQALAKQGKTPEGFKKSVGQLKKEGYLIYDGKDGLSLTTKGVSLVGEFDPSEVTNQVFHDEVIKPLLTKKGFEILKVISDGAVHDKMTVANHMNYDMEKLSGYYKDLSKLSTLGFLDKTATTIQLSDKAFPCGRP